MFIAFGIGLFLLIAYCLCLPIFDAIRNLPATKEEATSNFETHETDIMLFSDLLLSNKPIGQEIALSLQGDDGIVWISTSALDRVNIPTHIYDFRIDSIKKDSKILKELGWDLSTFKRIIDRFQKTNCERATTSDGEINLEFKTGIWGSIDYYVYAQPMDDNLKKQLNSYHIQILNSRAAMEMTIGPRSA